MMQQIFKVAIVLTMMCVLSGCVALLTPKVESNFNELKSGAYRLDKSHASLLFKVRHLGLSTYVGRFNEFDATLEFDPNNMQDSQLTALIDMTSLDINDDNLSSTLAGVSWLNSGRYPQAQFQSSKVKPINDSEFEFSGELSWRGNSKELIVTANFEGGAFDVLTQKYKLGFSAEAEFLRSDFGMDAFIPLVGDKIQIETYVEFIRN